jgi:hypothetical protein
MEEQDDKETKRQRDKERFIYAVSISPCLSFSISPRLPIPAVSPYQTIGRMKSS